MSDKKDIVLYFSPHQDDELLTMGVDISRTCLLPNKEVHVILCTDGSKSPARQRLNSGKLCKIHNQAHNYNLSEEEFIKARDCEFISSCKSLGVLPKNIHIYEKRAVDGSLSVEYAKGIIKHFVSIYGKETEVRIGAPFRFGKYQHEDHYNLGLAAKLLLKEKFFVKTKFFIEPYHLPKGLRKIFISLFYSIKREEISDQIKEKIEKAIQLSYTYWNPEEKKYAVGYHCVTDIFEYYKKNIATYCIKPRIII
jgi:LmbE family N-acetylglucosaminyl deacetylase